MIEIVSFMSRSDPAAFATIMLVQCTLATSLGLLIANRWRRNSAIQQTVLKAAIACALVCPAMTLAMKVGGLTLISIPVTDAEVRTDKPIVLNSSPAAPAVESVMVDVPEVASAVIVPEVLPANDSRTETIHSPIQETSPAKPEPIRNWPFRSLLPSVLAIWAIGVLCYFYGIGRSWWKLRKILNRTKSIEDARLVAVAKQVKSILSARRFPRVVSSTDVKCPVAAGFLHPVIILPEGLCDKLTSDELRMVLLHEAAHILRRDHLSLLFEQMFLAVYWFHPLSHLLVRRLAQAREEVCDNYVLQCVDGPSYSESLLRLTNLLPGLSPVPGGVGLFNLRWKLEERISGLLDDRRKTMLRTNLFTSLTIVSLMALAVLPIGVTQLVAQQKTPTTTDLQPESFLLETSPATASKPNKQIAAAPDSASAITGKTSPAGVASNIIARVNGEPITIEELEADLVKRYGKEHMGSLVRRKILEQACREKNITVSGSDIKEEAKRIAAEFGLSAEEFYRELEKNRDMDSSTYHSDVVWPTLVLKKLAGEEDASQYFKELEARAKVMVVENATTLAAHPNRRKNAGKKPSRIAFVNVGRVFKESVHFKERTEKLKAEVEQTQRSLQQLRSEAQSLQKAVDALSTSKGNDAVKADLEKLLVQKQLQLREVHQTSQQKLRQQESMSYLEVYRRIYDEVKSYSKEHGIELVLRDPGSPQSKSVFETTDPTTIDPRNSQAVLQKINQHVLYVDGAEEEKRLDITDAIIQRLKSKTK